MRHKTPLYTPQSLAELDAIAEKFRGAMADVFDFKIGPKRQDKLREATCRAIGFPNGLQQLQKSFPASVEGVRFPPELDEVLVLRTSDHDPEIFSVLVGASTLTPNRQGHIDEEASEACGILEVVDLDNDAEIQETYGLAADQLNAVLREHYQVTAMLYRSPDMEKYGVSDMAVEDFAPAALASLYGFVSAADMDHNLHETGDDGGDFLYLKLERRN